MLHQQLTRPTASHRINSMKPGRPRHEAKRAAVRLAWRTDPHMPRKELAKIGGITQNTLQVWLREFRKEAPLTEEQWNADLAARLSTVIEQAVTKTLQGLGGDVPPDKAWAIAAGAMKAAGVDAPNRHLIGVSTSDPVVEFGAPPVGLEAGDG